MLIRTTLPFELNGSAIRNPLFNIETRFSLIRLKQTLRLFAPNNYL